MAPRIDAHDQASWGTTPKEAFTWKKEPEPHSVRRKKILADHPEIKTLFKPDPISAVFCFCSVVIQISMAYLVRNASWPVLLLCTYVVSGTMNHSLQLAMHELSHDLWFPKRWQNLAFGFFSNLPGVFASSATFRRYHAEHHTDQGVDTIDTDIPSELEGKMFRGVPGKLFFVLFMPFFYSFRPMIIRPKMMNNMELANWVVQLSFDFFVLHYFGVKSLFYLMFGSLLGLGLHPMSGHFIAEHFEFILGQETYSYYGPLNYLAYNVGYHNEHHDFPRVPGRLLPKVREMAPEYYDTLPSYNSWSRVLYDFIFSPNVTLHNRVKRFER